VTKQSISSEEHVAAIVLGLGGRMRNATEGNCLCPAHDDHDPSLSVRVGYKGVILKCRVGCDQREIIAALRQRGLWHDNVRPPSREEVERRQAKQAEEAKQKAEKAQSIWERSRPIRGTPAEEYLRSRGIDYPLPPNLRFHPALDRPGFRDKHNPSWPGMVALVSGGKSFAIHRTYLERSPWIGWRKASDGDPRASLGAITGGVVRLTADKLDVPLVIAEGIETALSVGSVIGAPMTIWAAINAENLRQVVLPEAAGRRLIVAADNDRKLVAETGEYKNVGRDAAQKLADRAREEGWDARVIMPDTPRTDYNDVLMQRRRDLAAMREAAPVGSGDHKGRDQIHGETTGEPAGAEEDKART